MDSPLDIAFGIDIKGFPPTKFRVLEFDFSEMLSSLFYGEIEIACKADQKLSPGDLLEKAVTLTVHHQYPQSQSGDSDDKGIPVPVREFNGVIESVEITGGDDYWTIFSINIMPMLHYLRHTSDCRIFQQETVQDIVTKILEEKQVTEFSFNLKYPHNKREYCVQYNETHLGFIQRILAEEGIFFYFKQ